MQYTQGDWVFNEANYSIESTSEWMIQPNKDDNEEGLPIRVISTVGAMGGNNIKADIQLICAAPKMVEMLMYLLSEYDVITGGTSSSMTNEEIVKIKEIVNQAVGK